MMRDRIKAGIGVGILTVFVVGAIEYYVGARLSCDAFGLLLLVMGTVGATFGASNRDESSDDRDLPSAKDVKGIMREGPPSA